MTSFPVVGLTSDEALGNILQFVLAGFQMTADSLIYLFYEFAHHPEALNKVCGVVCSHLHLIEFNANSISRALIATIAIMSCCHIFPSGMISSDFA